MDAIDRINQKRRQAPRTEGQQGPFVATCAICNTEFSQLYRRRYKSAFMGKDYCEWCKGPAIQEVVLWLTLIEKLATMECQKPIEWWINHRKYSWCDLKCKCIPCTARTILRRERPKNLVPERVRVWHKPLGVDHD